MGHAVETLFLHSLKDNKRYSVKKPTVQEIQTFESTLFKIRNYNLSQESLHWKDEEVDKNTIYNTLYF